MTYQTPCAFPRGLLSLVLPIAITVSLQACSTGSAPSTRQAYLAARLARVDPNKPCFMEPFAPTPIKVIAGRFLIPVDVNGIETIGIVDTGAVATFITPELAAQSAAKPLPGVEHFVGTAGSFASKPVFLGKLQVGSIDFTWGKVAHVLTFGGSNGTKVGAQIGLDWLGGLDYDIDFAHEVMRPYRTTNCVLIDPPWRTTSTGLAITRGVRGFEQRGDGLAIPVAFEGGIINAYFDTGSSMSVMSHDAALNAGIDGRLLRGDPVKKTVAIDGRKREVYMHKVADLAIGEEELHDFPLLVAESFDRRDAPMVLGMDYIGKHHFWLSMTTDALYIDSGEQRKPSPPMDHAHWIAGAQIPPYPLEAKGEEADVTAQCAVEASGKLANCRIIDDGGHKAFAKVTLDWLNGTLSPIMQPAYERNTAVHTLHTWRVHFGKDKTISATDA